MSSIPGKVLSPKFVKKKPDQNTFSGSKVVGIEFSVTPIVLFANEPLVIKVLAVKSNDSTQDITQFSALSTDDADVVQVYPSGALIASTTGLTTLRAVFQDFEIEAPVAVISGTSEWTYFRWVMTVNSNDFTVTLPTPSIDDSYAVLAQLVSSANTVGIYLPDVIAGDRTVSTFRVITTSNLSIGDEIDFLVYTS